MNSDNVYDEATLSELANIPLSDLVESQDLELPSIEEQDLELPYEYINELMQEGIIGEDQTTIDIDSRFLESPELEQPPAPEEPGAPEIVTKDDDFDFGR